MSEPNNTFPFTGMETGGALDICAIFGSSTPGGELNPFEMPAAKGPVEMDPLPQEHAPAAGPKLEPAAEAESAAEPETEQPSAAPAPEEEIVTGPTRKQAVPPTEEPNLIFAAFDKQEEKNTQQGLLEKPPVFAYGSAKEPIKDCLRSCKKIFIVPESRSAHSWPPCFLRCTGHIRACTASIRQ